MTFREVIQQLYSESGCRFKKDFAEKIGISKQTLYNYENGVSEPAFSEACRIVAASGTKELAIISKFSLNEKEEKS